MIKKSKDIRIELESLRESKNSRGGLTGFKCIDALYTVKYGSYTCVLAAPHHGKSEFALEIALNQATKYGIKSLIYSPETGSVSDIYAELVHKITGKRVVSGQTNSISEKQYYQALNYIDEMFNIVDSDEHSLSFKELFDLAGEEDRLIVGDPYNEFKHDMSDYGGRQDLYIEDQMGEVRRFCKKTQRHFIMTLHPASQKQILDKETNKYYFGMPNAREAAGGQALYRKAMTWINLWRPPTFLKNSYGVPYEPNVLLGSIEKAKPKYVSHRGVFQINFDWERGRYYEDIGGSRRYAFDHEKDANNFVQGSLNMGVVNHETTESPF